MPAPRVGVRPTGRSTLSPPPVSPVPPSSPLDTFFAHLEKSAMPAPSFPSRPYRLPPLKTCSPKRPPRHPHDARDRRQERHAAPPTACRHRSRRALSTCGKPQHGSRVTGPGPIGRSRARDPRPYRPSTSSGRPTRTSHAHLHPACHPAARTRRDHPAADHHPDREAPARRPDDRAPVAGKTNMTPKPDATGGARSTIPLWDPHRSVVTTIVHLTTSRRTRAGSDHKKTKPWEKEKQAYIVDLECFSLATPRRLLSRQAPETCFYLPSAFVTNRDAWTLTNRRESNQARKRAHSKIKRLTETARADSTRPRAGNNHHRAKPPGNRASCAVLCRIARTGRSELTPLPESGLCQSSD